MNRALAALFAALAAAYIAAGPAPSRGPLPSDPRALAARVAQHPTDWIAASALTERALDAQVPDRVAFWRASHDLATSLAPLRPEPQAGFVRNGFFHWAELDASQRDEVLRTLAPLLGTRAMFMQMYQPMFALTGDVEYLRRSSPQTAETTEALAAIAGTYGRFEEYRALRAEAQGRRVAEFAAAVRNAGGSEVVAALPHPPYHDGERAIVAAALDRLHVSPIESEPIRSEPLDALIDYALRHDLSPLDGLEPVLRIPHSTDDAVRARLARRLGREDVAKEIEATMPPPHSINGWTSSCGDDVCFDARRDVVSHGGDLSIDIVPIRADDVPPYMEIYIDDGLRAEGTVDGAKTFNVAAVPAGLHHVEVRLANPVTRNDQQRRVRIVSFRSL